VKGWSGTEESNTMPGARLTYGALFKAGPT
jgi:hypothetical protein